MENIKKLPEGVQITGELSVGTHLPETAVGLCRGRHDMPVSEYIFDSVKDVLDYKAIQEVADSFVWQHCNVHEGYGAGLNQTDYSDVRIFRGDSLDVVVTGLTACTTAVMYACLCYGVPLTLWHYDRDSGDYVPQHFPL